MPEIGVNANEQPGNEAICRDYPFRQSLLVLAKPGDLDLNVDDCRTEYAPETLARFTRRFVNGTGVKGKVTEKDGREANSLGARPKSYVEFETGREKGNPHPAPMAQRLAEHLVALAVPAGGIILDPFAGSGTTAIAARKHGRRSVLIELSAEYCAVAAKRLSQLSLLAEGAA